LEVLSRWVVVGWYDVTPRLLRTPAREKTRPDVVWPEVLPRSDVDVSVYDVELRFGGISMEWRK